MHRELVFRITSIVIGLFLALVMGEALLGMYADHVTSQESMDDGLIEYHSTCGWKIAQNWSGRHQHYDYDVRYSTNEEGMRNSSPVAGQTDVRTLVIGDSFTFGLGVNDADTFVSQLNTHMATNGTEYINGGIPGYAPDQEIAWMNEAIAMVKPRHVLLVVYLGNDLVDLGLPFPLQAPYAKPYATLDDRDQLVINNVPVPKVSKPPALRQKAMANYIMEEMDVSWIGNMRIVQLIRDFGLMLPADIDKSLERKMEPSLKLFDAVLGEMISTLPLDLTLVFLPGSSVINSPRSISAKYQLLVRDGLINIAKGRDLDYLDLSQALSTAGPDLYYENDGHLTPKGHLVVAKAIEIFID